MQAFIRLRHEVPSSRIVRRSGHFGPAGRFRAAIDVFPVEPVPADAAVRRTKNILLSSHLAGGTRDSYRRISDLLVDEIPHILKGLPARRLQHAEPRLAALQRSR